MFLTGAKYMFLESHNGESQLFSLKGQDPRWRPIANTIGHFAHIYYHILIKFITEMDSTPQDEHFEMWHMSVY